MLSTYLRVKDVDQYGYCGRAHHPARADIGLIVRPISMDVYLSYDDGRYEALSADALSQRAVAAAFEPDRDDVFFDVCYTCITALGRVLELMAHEVEPA